MHGRKALFGLWDAGAFLAFMVILDDIVNDDHLRVIPFWEERNFG